jgi:hypothetical protein
VSDFVTHFRVRLANIVGSSGVLILPVLAVPGKPVEPGLFESGLALFADGFTSSLVFVVRGDVADPLMEPDAAAGRCCSARG